MLYSAPKARPMNCFQCQKSEQEILLQKCPICFKWVCDDCGRHDYGRLFCSRSCAQQFFFGDDDE